jgi:hypothetical protein
VASFIHSILRSNALIAADGDEVIDLPVNPLSVVLIHISPLNATLTDYSLWTAILGALETVRITHKGSAVVDASGPDLAVLAWVWHRLGLWQSGDLEADNSRRSLVVPVLFGRRPYDVKECFPETKKGELQLSMTWDIADTGYDGLRRSVETIELPEASPAFVQKVTTLATTFAAVGQQDVDLPIGNVLRAILLWGTTAYTGATPTPSWGQIEVMRDNRQIGYSATDWEVLRAVMGLGGVTWPADFTHIHSVNAAGAAREYTLEPQVGLNKDGYYALLNFDPTFDDQFSLETSGAGRVNVRADCEVADAVRVLPIERVAAEEFRS